MLYFQYVSATFSVISVWNHSQTSPRLSTFQLSKACFITFINIICLLSHKPPFTRSLTICWDPNWPRSLLAAFKILLLIEDSHQELVSAQFCFDLLCTHHYSTDCVTFDKCTFQRVGVGWVGSENLTDIKAISHISVAKLVTGFPRMIWTWASACRHFLGYFCWVGEGGGSCI